jgi:eukaryotic-like serine/threonine-protein kinase
MLDALGQYKILERLGESGLGETFRARDTRLGRTVAIVVVRPELVPDDARARFLHDARMATALSHPGIAALYEVGEDQGRLFLATEFLPGETLATVVARHPMAPKRAVDVGAQLADALADAHAAGIVHGGLDADHVVVTPRGSAKIHEFGLSAWARRGDRSAAGDYGRDIHDLGALLFRMLTGDSPGDEPVPAPSSRNPDSPPELDDIVFKALAADPAGQYRSAATLAADLRSAAGVLDRRAPVQPPSITVAHWQEPTRWIWIVPVILGVAGALWWGRAPIRRIWNGWFHAPPPPVLAVIPLRLDTADAGQLFFADGVSEDLAERLGRTPGLTVRGRSGLRRDRGRTPAEVASALGAGAVVTGVIRPQDDPMEISLALVAADGRSLWSAQYTRDPSAILATLGQAASEIAAALGLPPKPTAAGARAAARVVDPGAYRLYLRGRQAVAEGKPADAARFFDQASSADPGLAEAFAGLALLPDPSGAARRQAAAARALELDPDLPEANLAMANLTGDLSAALRYLRKAAVQDPSNGETYRRIASRIRSIDPQRAAAFDRAAAVADPRLAAAGAALAPVMTPGTPADRDAVRTALAGLID